MKRLTTDEEILAHLCEGRSIVDVRAPVEFAEGHLPGSFNLPLLDDRQRALVGTTYKQVGAEAAMKLGYELISGDALRERIATWTSFFRENPDTAVMCFRGGQRSQLVQAELLKHGFTQPLIEGGFKHARRMLSTVLRDGSAQKSWCVISGFTGAGKTSIMRSQNSSAFLDLEKAARHRGSSFGAWTERQPSSGTFESELAVDLSRLIQSNDVGTKANPIWIEDESKSIGKLVLPSTLFGAISSSPVWILEKARSERAVSLTNEYLTENYGLIDGVVPSEEVSKPIALDIRRAISNIERRLGGLETKTMLALSDESSREFAVSGRFSAHWPWVERVLKNYYDPLYQKHLSFIADRVVGRGPEEALRALVAQ